MQFLSSKKDSFDKVEVVINSLLQLSIAIF